MKSLTYLIFAILSVQFSTAQDFSVDLQEKVGLGKVGNIVHPLRKANGSLLKKFRSIPTNNGDTLSVLFTTLGHERTHSSYLKDTLFIAMITDSMYNRTICIDEDFDFDFTNNRAYKFTPETSYYPIVHIRTRQALNNDTLISYMPYQLQAFNNRVMIRGIMQEQTLTEAWNKEGTFVVNNNTYIIWLKEYLLNREGEKDFSFRFREVNDSTTVTAVYGRNDTITVDRWRYKIELNGNRLKFINTGSYSGHALDFQRKDLISKRNIQLTDFRGKYVLLDFWGSWCLPCIEGIPELKKLAATYSEKLEIISIAFDRDADIPKLKSIVRTYDMDWHHIREPREFNDSSNLTKKYDIRAYPTFVLIDKEGQIVLKAIGAEGLSRVRDRLSEMVDFM